MADKRAAPHPLFGDFFYTLFNMWDELALAGIMGALQLAVTRLPVNNQECYADFATHVRWPVPRSYGVTVLALSDAADSLAEQLRAVHAQLAKEATERTRGGLSKVTPAWVAALKNAARALFMVSFFHDGRVRRLVMAPHRCHRQVWRTVPPRRERLRTFLDQGAMHACIAFADNMTLTEGTAPGLAHIDALNRSFVTQIAAWWVTLSPSSAYAVAPGAAAATDAAGAAGAAGAADAADATDGKSDDALI